MAKLTEPVGDHTKQQPSEDLKGGTVIPSAKHNLKNKTQARLELVTAEIEEHVSAIYDQGLYLALATGPMAGKGDEEIINEAARITRDVQDERVTYGEALASIRKNGMEPKRPGVLDTQANKVEPDAPAKAPMHELFLPSVRVAYDGPFGIIRTRYHSVEQTGEFLVLIFDKRCTIVDSYAPPTSGDILTITVGEANRQKTYYTQALGINLDLDPNTRNMHITVLAVLDENHEMVLEQLGVEETEGELMPQQPGGIGQSTL